MLTCAASRAVNTSCASPARQATSGGVAFASSAGGDTWNGRSGAACARSHAAAPSSVTWYGGWVGGQSSGDTAALS